MRVTVRDHVLVYFTKHPDEWLTYEITASMTGCSRLAAFSAFKAMERDGLVSTRIDEHKRKVITIGPALKAMVDA